ncbi:hypothetical protein [Aquimarina sp. EL_43]|nr:MULTISPECIES: hypothetical protein [unclassified Aquimarina]
MKSMVGIGNPDLKIDLSTRNFTVNSNVFGKISLTGKQIETPVKEIVVYIEQSYIEKRIEVHKNIHEDKNKVTYTESEKSVSKKEKIAKVIIDTNGMIIKPGYTNIWQFELTINDIKFNRNNSKFFLKAFADIPGLDSKDKVEITISEPQKIIYEEPTAVVKESLANSTEKLKTTKKGINTNWRERLEQTHALLIDGKFTISDFWIGEPVTEESVKAAFSHIENVPDEVVNLYKQMNGAYINGYNDSDFEIHLWIPELERVPVMRENLGWGNNEITDFDIVFDGVSMDDPNCAMLKNGSNIVTLDSQGELEHSTLSFNEYLDLRFKSFLSRDFFPSLFIDINGKEYIACWEDFAIFVETFGKDQNIKANQFFTNYFKDRQI